MLKYLIQRLLLAVVTIFGVTVVIFVAMRVLPGDPLAIIYGEGQGIYVLTDAEVATAKASLGLDMLDENPPFFLIGFCAHSVMASKDVKGIAIDQRLWSKFGRFETIWLDR